MPVLRVKRPEGERVSRKDRCRNVPSTRSSAQQPTSCGQDFLDIQVHVSYPADNEVSCIVENERLSFAHLDKIIVDPYVINGQILRDKINTIKRNNHLNGVVWARLYKREETRMEMKQELANLLVESFVSIPQLIQNQNISAELKDYAERIQRGEMTFFYNRFAKYLRTGTLLELHNEGPQNQPVIEEDDLPW